MKKLLTKRTVLALLAIIFFLVAWNRSINLLYGMFALLAATLVLAMVLPSCSLRGVSAGRTLPSRAFEGENVDITISVSNRRRMARFMLELVDAFPAAGPGEREPMTFLTKLAGRSSPTYTYRIPCYKRGEYTIGPLRLRSAYPLGIAVAERTIGESTSTLLVYPRVFEITGLPLLAGGSTPMSGLEAAAKSGGNEEFFGTREYRRGDSLRHIHWPSSARHGGLIVKEFEVRAATEATIVLDLHQDSEVGEERETTLEYGVRVAASIARYALDRGHAVQLAACGRRDRLVPSGRSSAHFAEVLEELARVAADGATPYHQAIMRAAEFMRDGSTAVLIMTESGLRKQDLPLGVDLLLAKRIRLLCVVIDSGSFRTPPRPALAASDPALISLRAVSVAVYRISRGDDLPGVFAQ